MLFEFQCKASFASEVYFSRTRAACEQLKAKKALMAVEALENTKAESSDAFEDTKATPDASFQCVSPSSFGVSIKQERQDDSEEVPFVTRIPLENIKSEPTDYFDDFIHSQNVYKKRKLEEDEPEKPKQKAKSKTKQKNSKTKQEKYKEGKVNCHTCGLVMSSKYSLKRHIARHHKQTIVYKCGFCENAYNNMEEYKEHNIAEHQDIFEDFFKRNGAVDLLQELKDQHFDQHFGLRRFSET